MNIEFSKKNCHFESDSYLNSHQIQYFKRRLLVWRDQLHENFIYSKASFEEVSSQHLILNDLLNDSIEFDRLNKNLKLINMIDETLRNIETGTYGINILNRNLLKAKNHFSKSTIKIKKIHKHNRFIKKIIA